jgi:antitoxin PrlF
MAKGLKKQAKITSKGQITVPREIRRALGVGPGDKLIFEEVGASMRVRPAREKNAFAKYQGIGIPGWPSGRKAILRKIRELRGR